MFKNFNKKTIVGVVEPINLTLKKFDDLSLEYDIENIANKSGRDNLPSSSSKEIGSDELLLQEELKKDLIQTKNKVEISNKALQSSLQEIRLEKNINSINEIPNDFKSEAKHIVLEGAHKLKRKSIEKRSAEDELERFKKENKLKRSANYPLSNTFTFGLLALLLVVETLVNSAFFAEGSDLGLLGGIFLALSISFLNVVPSFVVGRTVTTMSNSIQPLKKIIGILFTTCFVGLFFCFNLAVAHYRDALILNPDEASSLAIANFQQNLLGISDFQSWFLFLMGFFFCLTSLRKGYKSDDIYPGYGEKDRVYRNLQTELAHISEDLINELSDVTDEYLGKVEELHEQVVNAFRKFENFENTIKTQEDLFDTYVTHIHGAYEYMIKLYREKNEAARTDEPPEYFGHIEHLTSNVELKRANVNERRQELKQQLSACEQNLPLLNKLINDSSEMFKVEIQEVVK